jgi:hypothetical protein
MALGQDAYAMFGVICPMMLLGISFAVLVAPLTASALSSATIFGEERQRGHRGSL